MYQQQHYAKKAPFSSFLSGIAGEKGIPMWVFYVNRGQLISSFGTRDKNGALMEFFPADQAYMNVSQIGFRTFIKINGVLEELFLEKNAPDQSMTISLHEVSIKEYLKPYDLEVEVTYFTLPETAIPGFIRKVQLKSNQAHSIEIVDGLMRYLPANVDAGLLKNMSNTLRSWMRTEIKEGAVYYNLSASVGDASEVSLLKSANTYQTIGLNNMRYITDLRVLFDQDVSYQTPYGFIEGLDFTKQAHVNQVPSAMTYATIELKGIQTFYSVFSALDDMTLYPSLQQHFSPHYFEQKQLDNQMLHERLVSGIETKSGWPTFDAYLKQSYMDNVLRGGIPKMIETKEGLIPYYIYSRKHGDLERDYNFFSLEANVLSQGNGNFRDVLQNRRTDLLFEPRIKHFNIEQFMSFIQADGYNPLNIQGILMTYHGDKTPYEEVNQLLQSSFAPGQLMTKLMKVKDLSLFDAILKQSTHEFVAHYHEGYWGDHFTYLYDLVESFESIYPDQLQPLFEQTFVKMYQSPVRVVSRSEKYVLNKEGKVRQYGALKGVERKGHWRKNPQEQALKVSILSKVLTLVFNRFSHLDPDHIGLMYEAEKPGWNDAMNGLPGLFGSGVSELIELFEWTRFLTRYFDTYEVKSVEVLSPLRALIEAYQSRNHASSYDMRQALIEAYREDIETNLETTLLEGSLIQTSILTIHQILTDALETLKKFDIIPTYYIYEAVDYEVLNDRTHYGYPSVKINSFKGRPLPIFLEAPARFMKTFGKHAEPVKRHEAIMKSSLYDAKVKMFKTSESLESESFEIGRVKAFTPGWLERESIFLHMTYKYLLGLLKAEAYDQFYEAIQTNFVCFKDAGEYGRSTLENSSFIASSNNPDPLVHGRGFVARLSGSTAELISMWRYMMFGKTLFSVNHGELSFQVNPHLTKEMFVENVLETTLFSTIKVIYSLENPNDMTPSSYTLKYKDQSMIEIIGEKITGSLALQIRNQEVVEIKVKLGHKM
jgi:hypothetical protein